jgi:hypothetical protein
MSVDTNQKVGLGCGTLILIALIVVIFGNAGSRGLEDEVKKLRQDVLSLQSQMSLQTQTLQSMNAALAEIKASQANPGNGR